MRCVSKSNVASYMEVTHSHEPFLLICNNGSQSWYVANCDWGDNPQAVWEWMVQAYKYELSRGNSFTPSGGGGFGGGGWGVGGGRPRSPKMSDWKAEADAVLKVKHV